MEQNDFKSTFKQKFEAYSGSRFEICYDIYRDLKSCQEQDRMELLSYACNNFGIKDSNGSYIPEPSGVSQSVIDALKDEYGQIVDALLDSLLQRAMKAEMPALEFYTNIWNLVVQNPIFSTDAEKAFALYYILIDDKIPYFPISTGLEMENSEFRSLIEECEESIQKAKFVLAVDFPQKTMEASNLIDIILSQNDYKKQVIVMSRIVSDLRNKNRKLLDAVLDKVKENI